MPHHGRGRRSRDGPGGLRARPAGNRRRAARRPHQRGRATALGLRRPFRPGGGNRAGRGNEGEHAGAEIPSRGTGVSLVVLAVDDEPPALDELAYLLNADSRVAYVHRAGDATEALRVLRDTEVDAVFLDIRMPGLDGMELARILRRFARPPAIVFVTAYDDGAVDAFDLGVTDYVRKPVRAERLAESLRRVAGMRSAPPGSSRIDELSIPVELAGTTRMLPRSSVRWVEAQGDYARLHTADASHLVRVSLATLAERWADAGFARIHRSYLVQLRVITELRLTHSGYVVAIDGTELPVSRRHTRELKDRLIRAAKVDWTRS